MHMNTRPRLCQDIEQYGSNQRWVIWNTMPPGAHLSTRLCPDCHLTVGVQHGPSAQSLSLAKALPVFYPLLYASERCEASEPLRGWSINSVWPTWCLGWETRQMVRYPIDLKQANQAHCRSDFVGFFSLN